MMSPHWRHEHVATAAMIAVLVLTHLCCATAGVRCSTHCCIRSFWLVGWSGKQGQLAGLCLFHILCNALLSSCRLNSVNYST